jgi:hypothetical protein
VDAVGPDDETGADETRADATGSTDDEGPNS